MTAILSFIVVVGVIIFVHELGHFLAAKSVGIRVETFSLGFPPRMLCKRVGETDYCLSWVPLGGYVKMAGMIDESATGETKLTGAPWEFASKNTWQKLWVVSAGVIMNLLLGVILYTGISAIKGLAEPSTESVIGALTPEFPAEQAGLHPDDRIVSIDGVAVNSWEDILTQVRPRPGAEVTIVYQREGAEHEVKLTTRATSEVVDGQRREIGQIGIGPAVIYRPGTVGQVLLSGVIGTTNVVVLVASTVWKLVTLQVSVKELGGPILIAKMAGDSARRGITTLLEFLALISINIGCFNLLPIPALDGGHGLIVLAEGIVRRQIPTRAKLIIQNVGLAMILCLVVLIIVNDAERVFHLDFLKRVF